MDKAQINDWISTMGEIVAYELPSSVEYLFALVTHIDMHIQACRQEHHSELLPQTHCSPPRSQP